MDETFTIELSRAERHYLHSLIGWPTPSPDVSELAADSPRSQTVLRAAAEALAARHYVRLPDQVGSTIAVDQTVAALLAVASFPEHGLVARAVRDQRARAEELQLLSSGGLLVEVRQGEDGAYTLTACRTQGVALGRLLSFLGVRKQPAAHDQSFRIAADDMEQLPYIIAGSGAEDGGAFLQAKGVPAIAATRFATALANPAAQSLVQALVWEDGQPRETVRLALVEEAFGLWVASPSESTKGVLEIVPASAAEVAERLRLMATHILPPEPHPVDSPY